MRFEPNNFFFFWEGAWWLPNTDEVLQKDLNSSIVAIEQIQSPKLFKFFYYFHYLFFLMLICYINSVIIILLASKEAESLKFYFCWVCSCCPVGASYASSASIGQQLMVVFLLCMDRNQQCLKGFLFSSFKIETIQW